jgi:CheY-like chemotaxis protein
MLAFAVKDNGTGIAPDYLPLLFEPFTQGDSSSTRKYEGTGLGLSICKNFVSLMHGTIGVDSMVGQGSTFSFTVRLVRAATPIGSMFDIPPDIRGMNVLVVDDCADSRTIMAKILTTFDFQVETVNSGEEAIRRLQAVAGGGKPVDMILMDWKMPGMNGLEASRKIRLELHLTQPIIIMTAFAREVHKSEAEQAGTNGFLTKPIFQSTLFDAIMDAFGKEGTRKGGVRTDFTTRASMYKKHLRGCKILVAEDNYTNQQVARAILEGAGVLVKIVDNGEEAVAAVQNERFDGVLMDIQMPKMNGYQATRRIRALPVGNDLPIVAMTAHAMKGDEEKCLEAGMDGYVAKPINQDRFFYTLWRLLRNRQKVTAAVDYAIDAPGDEAGAEELPVCDDQTPFPCRLIGIDVAAALQATGLDWPTYQEILAGFFQDNTETAKLIQQARDQKDTGTLRNLAHRLKGSAANIGACDVQQAADSLERGCNGESAEIVAELTAKLLIELDCLLGVLEPLALAVDQDDDTVAVSDGQDDTEALLLTLTRAINRADPIEIHALTVELRKQFAGRKIVDQSLIKNLDTQIRRYDYDQALETIARIRDALEKHR